MLLNPFLDVIRSGNTTGPIAGAALSSVEKFLQYGIIGEDIGGVWQIDDELLKLTKSDSKIRRTQQS
jgi:hypothetical protein